MGGVLLTWLLSLIRKQELSSCSSQPFVGLWLVASATVANI